MTAIGLDPRGLVPSPDVNAWLFTNPERAVPSTARVLKHHRREPESARLKGLTKVGRAALAQEVLTAFRSIVHESVVDVVVDGWRRHRTLVEAAEASVRTRTDQLVQLKPHRVTFGRDPSVDVFLSDIRVLTISGRLELTVQITDAVATVRAGRLVAVHAGRATASGTVALEGQRIASQSAHWHLPDLLKFEHGLDLASRPAHWLAGRPHVPRSDH